jgi:hypothetical protein
MIWLKQKWNPIVMFAYWIIPRLKKGEYCDNKEKIWKKVKKVELLGNGVGRNGRKKVWGGRVLTQQRERLHTGKGNEWELRKKGTSLNEKKGSNRKGMHEWCQMLSHVPQRLPLFSSLDSLFFFVKKKRFSLFFLTWINLFRFLTWILYF